MGELDFNRFDLILRAMDTLALSCGSQDPYAVKPYLNALKIFYRYLRPILYDSVKNRLDMDFEDLKREIEGWLLVDKGYTRFPRNTYDKLDKLHTTLLEIRQIVGLGIVVRSQESLKKRLERGLGVKPG